LKQKASKKVRVMTRLFCVPVLIVLLGVCVVPVIGQDDQSVNEIEDSWKHLSRRSIDGIVAALRMTQEPDDVVAFLQDHLVTVEMNEEKFARLLEDLSSDDEATWENAYREFEYHDPRLLDDIEVVFERAPRNPAHNRMAGILSNFPLTSFKDEHMQSQFFGAPVVLDRSATTGHYRFVRNGPAGRSTSWSARYDLSDWENGPGWQRKTDWNRAVRAILVLDQINTPAAQQVIERIASGHEKAPPTVTARRVLDDSKSNGEPGLSDCWDRLMSPGNEAIVAALNMAGRPDETVEFLANVLEPVELSEMQFNSLVTELGSDDEATWQSAFGELKFRDPRLLNDIESILASVPHNPERLRMIGVLSGWTLETLYDRDAKFDDEEEIRWSRLDEEQIRFEVGDETWVIWAKPSRQLFLNAAIKPQWKRVADAVAVLERIGSLQAISLIEDIAAGDEDAPTTSLAKQVLARIGDR
ncbi:MAG: hypothetical protein ACR2NP_14005, partial [Pirellulaceae bacterium]